MPELVDTLACTSQTLFACSQRKCGRDLPWTLRGMAAPEWVVENWLGSVTIPALRCQRRRDGKPVEETRYDVTTLRTIGKALVPHVRALEHQALLALAPAISNSVRTRTKLAMHALGLDGYWTITKGLAVLAYAIPGLLGWGERTQSLSSS